MLKIILAIIAMLYAVAAFAAVDVNKATAAELDGIKGVGPSISTKIIEERKKGNFKDWYDFIERVKGVGGVNAANFANSGLTVNGAVFKSAAAVAAPAPVAKEEKKDPKAEAKMKADDAKMAKAEEKAKKAEEAKAKKEAAKQAKEDAKKAKAEKKDAKLDSAKADAPKDAASAPKK